MNTNNFVVNGNGIRGTDGQHGYSFHGHASPGHHGITVFDSRPYLTLGSHGGNATRPTNGGDAETIHVVIGRPTFAAATYPPGQVIVKVDRHEKRCRSTLPHTQNMEEYAHDLGMDGMICISARGGDGGTGGHGGDAEGGGHGRDGMDATKYSMGTNGQHGCDGGNAGQGSSGGNGGKGSDITIFLNDEDKNILVAMHAPVVAGGKGGAAGDHGLPGLGGRGGEGGDSYSWF